MPLSVVHEVAVLRGFFFVKQAHRSAAPNLTNASSGVAVEHESGGVKTLHGAEIAAFGVK